MRRCISFSMHSARGCKGASSPSPYPTGTTTSYLDNYLRDGSVVDLLHTSLRNVTDCVYPYRPPPPLQALYPFKSIVPPKKSLAVAWPSRPFCSEASGQLVGIKGLAIYAADYSSSNRRTGAAV